MKMVEKYHTVFFVKVLLVLINSCQVHIDTYKKLSPTVLTLALFTLIFKMKLRALFYLLDMLYIYSALKQKKHKHGGKMGKTV